MGENEMVVVGGGGWDEVESLERFGKGEGEDLGEGQKWEGWGDGVG